MHLVTDVLLAATLAAPSAFAGAPGAQQTDLEDQVLAKIHLANQEEIADVALIKGRSQRPEMVPYGQMIATDHQEADKLVLEVAAERHVDVMAILARSAAMQSLALHYEALQEHLSVLSGDAFDKAMLQQLLADHVGAITELSQVLKSLPADSSVAVLINRLMPKLEEHRDATQRLLTSITAS